MVPNFIDFRYSEIKIDFDFITKIPIQPVILKTIIKLML